MKKKVFIAMDKTTGAITLSFEGYTGDDCIKDRGALLEQFRRLGLDVVVTSTERHPDAQDGNCVLKEHVHDT